MRLIVFLTALLGAQFVSAQTVTYNFTRACVDGRQNPLLSGEIGEWQVSYFTETWSALTARNRRNEPLEPECNIILTFSLSEGRCFDGDVITDCGSD